MNRIWTATLRLMVLLLVVPGVEMTASAADAGPDDLPTVLNVSPVEVGGGSLRRQVRALAMDERGFVWIGTLGGLVRCDGDAVTEFLHDPNDPGTLSGNGIWSLCADGDGHLWAGTWGDGLNRISIRDGRIRQFRHRADDPRSLPDDRIRALFADREHRLWIGTEGAGVAVFHPESRRFLRLKGYSGMEGDLYRPVRQFRQDNAGRIWAATYRGLYCIDKGGSRLNRVWPGEDADQVVRALVCSPDGTIWVAAQSGLFQVRDDGQVVRTYRADSPRPERRLQHPVPASLLEDREGRIWVGFVDRGGLDRVDGQTGRITHIPPATGGAGRLWDDGAIEMIQDASGLIWCGFQKNGGVSVINPRRRITHILPGANGLSDSEVTAVLQDRSGRFWFGTAGGLDCFDADRNRWIHYRNPGRDIHGNAVRYILSLMESEQGRIWAGTWGGGVWILDPSSGRVSPLTAVNDSNFPLANPAITTLHRGAGGRVWMGTDGGGLACWDPRTSRITRYRYSHRNPRSLGSDIVMAICEDGGAGLWIGTWGGGLTHMIAGDGDMVHYRYDPGNPDSLSNDTVLCLARDRRGRVWAGTHGGGVSRLDPEAGVFRRYTQSQGLPDNMVMAIQEDRQGQMWIATASGMARLNPRNNRIRVFDRRDGMLTRGFTRQAAGRDRRGRLFFGGIGGVTAFFPSDFRPDAHVPPLQFTRLERFSRRRVQVCLPETPSIRMGYRESFRISFSALDYTNPGRNRYAYRLEKSDKEWIDLGQRRSITFAGMQPGRYRLHVRGASSDGAWNLKGAVMRIRVVPPVWMSWWFRGLLLLSLVALSLYWHGTRMRRQAGRLRQLNEIDGFCRRCGVTVREREVLVLLLQGMSRTRIADKLIISDATVKNHTYSLYRKLNIRSRAQLFSLFGAWKR